MNSSREPFLHTALLQFVFPFSIRQGERSKLFSHLEHHGYTPFYLHNKELEDAYYGEGYCVSHERMERSYLPFAAHVLFPHEPDSEAFTRYSRKETLEGMLETPNLQMPFRILSTDVLLCPFRVGFVTVRIDISRDGLTFSQAMEFADRFRMLEDVSEEDNHTRIREGERSFRQSEDFLFKHVIDGLEPFLDRSDMTGAYFETLPFFVDERMMVQAFYGLEDEAEIDERLRFRASQMDGMDLEGQPYISASDPEYIADYTKRHGYTRWAPNTHYVMNEQTFCCLSKAESETARKLANQMYGEYYYGLLLNIFHKIVLLKLANIHAKLKVEKDYEEVEELIVAINKFSAKYYFMELISQSQGRELFYQLRQLYGNDKLYEEVKQTLDDLFQYQDKFSTNRRDQLLMILTLYSVVGGIYGMNQVIEDLKGDIDWSKLQGYSLFEYLALFVTFSGIVIGLGITVREAARALRNRRKRRKSPSRD